MDTRAINYVQNQKEELVIKWTERMKETTDDRIINVVSDQVFVSTGREFIDLIASKIVGLTSSQSPLDDFVDKIVQLGWTLGFVSDGFKAFEDIFVHALKEEGFTDTEQLTLYSNLDSILTPLYNEIVNRYTSTWERTVSLQKTALQELSAPLIPVFEGITVMPLIGTIDTERAKQIMENLLNGVVNHRSEVVLIDITGVPVVDTMVAHHIIQAAEAVRLVGSKCMLVGIRPEIAQTIVNLGIDLEHITTKNTLQKGIESALELTSRKIVKLEGAE
ncbi:RsbT co-antagonist protein RsbRA [Bacillus carboniphilus]|uniref:RsbT co-antagonist protein RsbRA n=1 Tax=Bacillus carboniphilus TaxID=86663 RepID=A0ABP3FRJ1_9BACI